MSPPPRPRVLLNFASTVDGKITAAPELRVGPLPLSRHAEDPRRMRELRASADAILIGASNLRVDDPDLALSLEEHLRRQKRGEKEPARVVLTRSGDGVTPRHKMFDASLGGPSYVVHTSEMSEGIRSALSTVATTVSLGKALVDVPAMLGWLSAQLGVQTLLCEGGGAIAAQLFAARAVDQLFVTLVPRILGGIHAPTLAGGLGFRPDEIPDATLGSCERVGDELFLRYDFSWR